MLMVCRTAQPYAHGAEQAIARIRSTLESRYFIVFTVDTTLGVLIAYVLHQQALKFARRKQASSECVAGHIICACIECRPSPSRSRSPSPQGHGALLTPFGVCSKWPEWRCVQFPRESRQMRSIWQSASGTHASTSLAVRVCAWVLQQSNPHLARLRFACVPLTAHRFLPVAFKARHLPTLIMCERTCTRKHAQPPVCNSAHKSVRQHRSRSRSDAVLDCRYRSTGRRCSNIACERRATTRSRCVPCTLGVADTPGCWPGSTLVTFSERL